nr:uncharacterized protein LOC112008446 [Quercus suber]
MAIKNAVREWIHEESDIKEFIRRGFNEIYSTSHESTLREDPITLHCLVRLSDGDRESIGGEMAFVSGRKGIDNVIIALEIIHSLGKKKGRTGYMALKIDLEKAYDKLEWGFIRNMLDRINFPMKLIDVIMSCVSTLIEEKCNMKTWQPVKASQSGFEFSHLLFANDLIFFAKADWVNCFAIRDVLYEFCELSGQSVSEAKSRVYFSPNVDRDTRESPCDILGFTSTPFLGKYLGFPLKHPGSSSQEYNFILDRVKKKHSGSKANMLSLVGRTVLIQAFLVAILSLLTRNVMMRIRWEKSVQGWWKLNTDGSYCSNTGLAGCGGVVRDDVGSPPVDLIDVVEDDLYGMGFNRVCTELVSVS